MLFATARHESDSHRPTVFSFLALACRFRCGYEGCWLWTVPRPLSAGCLLVSPGRQDRCASQSKRSDTDLFILSSRSSTTLQSNTNHSPAESRERAITIKRMKIPDGMIFSSRFLFSSLRTLFSENKRVGHGRQLTSHSVRRRSFFFSLVFFTTETQLNSQR